MHALLETLILTFYHPQIFCIIARVVPIPKPGSEKDTTAGYRPISILPIASKIIERHMKEVLEEHLKKYARISPRQWGFMADRSTMSALIQVVDDCA